MAPARAATLPESGPQGVSPMDVVSVARTQEMMECFRHEGEEYPRCYGSGYRSRKWCAGCGEPSGRPSKDGKALISMKNSRDRSGSFYCMVCHPEMNGRGTGNDGESRAPPVVGRSYPFLCSLCCPYRSSCLRAEVKISFAKSGPTALRSLKPFSRHLSRVTA